MPETVESTLEQVEVKVVALFDPADGRIVHKHVVRVFEGGRAIGDDEAIQTARDQAGRAGHTAADELEVLVSSNAEHAARPHRIDLATKDFVLLTYAG
ncbi:MAG TPA: hypothetical protein VFM96_14210 [Gaiellaceae bacterium]|nr:hypothetical protein [Gaiellaceae bacterium]